MICNSLPSAATKFDSRGSCFSRYHLKDCQPSKLCKHIDSAQLALSSTRIFTPSHDHNSATIEDSTNCILSRISSLPSRSTVKKQRLLSMNVHPFFHCTSNAFFFHNASSPPIHYHRRERKKKQEKQKRKKRLGDAFSWYPFVSSLCIDCSRSPLTPKRKIEHHRTPFSDVLFGSVCRLPEDLGVRVPPGHEKSAVIHVTTCFMSKFYSFVEIRSVTQRIVGSHGFIV